MSISKFKSCCWEFEIKILMIFVAALSCIDEYFFDISYIKG